MGLLLHRSHLLPAALSNNCACVAGSEHFSISVSVEGAELSRSQHRGSRVCFLFLQRRGSHLKSLVCLAPSAGVTVVGSGGSRGNLMFQCWMRSVCLRGGCTPYPWFCRNRTPVIISQEPPVTMDSTPCSPSCCWRAWMLFKTRIFSVRRDLQNLSHPTAPYSSSPAFGHSSLRSLSLIVHRYLNISDCKTYF